MSQGKEWDKEKTIEILKPLFELDYSVTKACKIAGIPQSTVATWIMNDQILQLKINYWRGKINREARENWVKAIKEGKLTKFGRDKYTPAKEWLERRERNEFSLKSEVDVKKETEVKLTTEEFEKADKIMKEAIKTYGDTADSQTDGGGEGEGIPSTSLSG